MYIQTAYLVGIVISFAITLEFIPIIKNQCTCLKQEDTIDTAINNWGKTVMNLFVPTFLMCSCVGLMVFCIYQYSHFN